MFSGTNAHVNTHAHTYTNPYAQVVSFDDVVCEEIPSNNAKMKPNIERAEQRKGQNGQPNGDIEFHSFVIQDDYDDEDGNRTFFQELLTCFLCLCVP